MLYQNVTKNVIEYIEFLIRVEYGRLFDFNGELLSFFSHLVEVLSSQRAILRSQLVEDPSAKQFH